MRFNEEVRFKKTIVLSAVALVVLSVGGAALASNHGKATTKGATKVARPSTRTTSSFR